MTVALITSRVRDIPVEVLLGTEDGMPRPCVVNCDEIHTVPVSILDNPVTGLTQAKMQAVAAAVRFALDVECD